MAASHHAGVLIAMGAILVAAGLLAAGLRGGVRVLPEGLRGRLGLLAHRLAHGPGLCADGVAERADVTGKPLHGVALHLEGLLPEVEDLVDRRVSYTETERGERLLEGLAWRTRLV